MENLVNNLGSLENVFNRAVVLIGVITLMTACSHEKSESKEDEISQIDRIRKQAELSLASSSVPDQFYEKNPEYNPLWLAKLIMDKQEVAALEEELRGKEHLNMRRSTKASDLVPWWTPSENAKDVTYMTSHNAPVTIVLSPKENLVEVFIMWSSP